MKILENSAIMSFTSILSAFSRLSLHVRPGLTRNITTNLNPLCFRATNVLLAEPLKKKKKVDPAVVRQREERKKKKLEKAIRRLERHARQLKPIDELEVPLKLIDGRKQRLRKLPAVSAEVVEQRTWLGKTWAKYKCHQHMTDVQLLDRVLLSQQKALNELKAESEDLYFEAIQPDLSLIPYESKGPVFTPPIENYATPDGEYHDKSRIWENA